MFTVPVVIFTLSGALVLVAGIAIGGIPLIMLGALGLIALGLAYLQYRRAARDNAPVRLPGGALAGVATILNYRDIGSTMEDEPMIEATLRISIPGREPYNVKLCDVISLYASSRLTTNAAFRCAVDPGHPRDIVVRWEQPVALEGVSDPQNRLGVHTPVRTDASLSAAAVLAGGLPAMARIVQSSSQGTVAPNGDPIMIFILHVVPDSGTPPFQSLTAQRVPPERLDRTASGTLVRVAYDPENRTRVVAIDWDQAPAEEWVTPTTVMPGSLDDPAPRERFRARAGRHTSGTTVPPVVVTSPNTSG